MSTPDRPQQDRRRRHLIDFDAPRPVRDPEAEALAAARLLRVQRWVMSTLAVTTILHLVVGIVLAAVYLADHRLAAQVGLNVVAGLFAVMAVAAARAIHGRPMASPWLLLGLLVIPVGLWVTLA